ncbi:MAG TPA: DUF4097 family beta strand repeat-containing protein [Candidatus Desulfaltia sp.]|nr:DUF4097 family beta strand repeat-containing protein [Candidatus Desulfaltia sp.]
MKTIVRLAGIIVLLWAVGMADTAQQSQADHAVVSFTNPAKPGTVEVDVNEGSITVRGYEGKNVIIDARWRERALTQEKREIEAALAGAEEELDKEELAKKKAQAEKSRGMKMLAVESMGLTIEEEDNVIQVSVEEGKRAVDLIIQVPFSTSLQLSCRDDERGVTVERVDGEIEVDTSDGPITLTNVSGPVVADSSEGEIKVVFGKITPGKPMSLSAMDGDIDITLPLDVKASLKMKTDEGQIFTDFDVQLTPSQQKKEEDERKEGGGYRVTYEKVTLGLINGGGTEIQLTTYEGNIYVRKAK